VVKSGNRYIIKDEGSGTGVFVNGRKVDSCVLQPGDIVTIGQTVLKYHDRSK
jgi:pSer/pThr/pTyr-binding forkhead associated (FHA) protein